MPRIRTSDSDPIDFCRKCFPVKRRAEAAYAQRGHGPDGRGNCFEYDDDHPDYTGEDYTCENCGRALTTRDN